MATGTLEIFFISADISPQAHPHADNTEIYVVLRCNKEQKFTQIVGGHGRRPVWNEVLIFDFQQQDSSKDFLIDLYARSSPVDEFLGSASIPIADMLGKEVTQTCTLVSPSKVEIGKLRIDWKWKPGSQVKGKDQDIYSKLDAVSDALTQMSVAKTSSAPTAPPYHTESMARTEEVRTVSRGYDQHSSGYPPAQYTPSDDHPPPGYPPSGDQPAYGYPPSQYPPSQYPPLMDTAEKGDTTERGHSSGYPYQYPPAGGYYPSQPAYPSSSHGYPPAPHGYPPAPQGYPPAPHGYPPSTHGYPPAPHGYPPAPHGYPPAAHGYPPAPHGYPPAPHGYPSAPIYAPHGGHYGGHHEKHKKASYKIGHGGYMGYPGYHSSKHSKKHKMPKHGWSHHHKHKKYKFGKGFKGFKMKKMMKFKKFKF